MFRRYRFSQISRALLEASRNYAGVHQKAPNIRLPPSRITELKEKLNLSPVLSAAEWGNIRKGILDERRFNETNVDSTVLGMCVGLESGKSYVKFLRENGVEMNLATVGKLLRLYRTEHSEGVELNEEHRQEIVKFYEELHKKNAMLDANTCEHLVAALTLTDHWRVSFELLDMIKLSGIPDGATFSYLIEKCFQIGDVDVGWELLEEMTSHKRLPKDDVFLAWIAYSLKDPNCFKQNMIKMLSFTNAKSLFLSKRIGQTLVQIPTKYGLRAVETRVTEKGKCSSCKSTLASIVVPDDMFSALRDAFIQAVIIKKEIFNKTTPKELERFQMFLKKTKPYDVVIDGLNVAFSTGNQKSPAVYAMQIASVVKHYVRQRKRVLVIGRQHMDRWRSKDMKYIRENAFLFLTEDLSQDDPFLLYAALESGPHTDFFSRDLMRRHSFLLGDELGGVFKRWQQEHQYSLLSITNDGRVIINSPFQYDMFAHCSPENANRWHVPLVENSVKIPKVEKQACWLCVEFE
ncbi:mitochondrial ribonuclease P catalytic subunit [Armigeres subalbatus]|uniref:mitochondrial ribonuclease P catalytic subunit n=1 Tax=Armigeres subalbatus TaxID=124917 RepID=UPI002ED60F33